MSFNCYQFWWPWATNALRYLTLYSFCWDSLCGSEWRWTHTNSSKEMLLGL